MDVGALMNHIIIAPQIYVPLEAEDLVGQEPRPRRTEIPMTWTQEGNIFRLDIDLPESSVLDIYFSSQVSSLHVNGETIWDGSTIFHASRGGIHAEVMASGLRLTCTLSGSLHILALCISGTPVNIQNGKKEGK